MVNGFIDMVSLLGGEFLLSAIKVPDENRCYFSVTKAGKPLSLQRKPYTECFYIMGLAELYKATNTQKYLVSQSINQLTCLYIDLNDCIYFMLGCSSRDVRTINLLDPC